MSLLYSYVCFYKTCLISHPIRNYHIRFFSILIFSNICKTYIVIFKVFSVNLNSNSLYFDGIFFDLRYISISPLVKVLLSFYPRACHGRLHLLLHYRIE